MLFVTGIALFAVVASPAQEVGGCSTPSFAEATDDDGAAAGYTVVGCNP